MNETPLSKYLQKKVLTCWPAFETREGLAASGMARLALYTRQKVAGHERQGNLHQWCGEKQAAGHPLQRNPLREGGRGG